MVGHRSRVLLPLFLSCLTLFSSTARGEVDDWVDNEAAIEESPLQAPEEVTPEEETEGSEGAEHLEHSGHELPSFDRQEITASDETDHDSTSVDHHATPLDSALLDHDGMADSDPTEDVNVAEAPREAEATASSDDDENERSREARVHYSLDQGAEIRLPELGGWIRPALWTQIRLGGSFSSEEISSTFRIRRLRPRITASLASGWIAFRFLSELAGGGLDLLDLYVELSRLDAFRIRVGQMKPPFSRGFITPSRRLQFLEMAQVARHFRFDRDIGAEVYGLPFDGRFEYRLGIFNGNGRNTLANDDAEFLLVARLSYHPFGNVQYRESDFESQPGDPLLAIAVSGAYLPTPETETDPAQRIYALEADIALKAAGMSLVAEYFYRWQMTDDANLRSWGVYSQVGYFLFHRRLEWTVRYGHLVGEVSNSPERAHEVSSMLTWVFVPHRIELSLQYRVLLTQSGPIAGISDTHDVTLQLLFEL